MPEPGAHIILDTDIGSDVDDLVALVLIGRLAPERLRGITTVYGDTLLRARQAAHVCELMALPDIPIIAGAGRPLHGADMWTTGDEGAGWSLRGSTEVRDRSGLGTALNEVVGGEAEVVDLIAIGPLTNVANALREDSGFAARIGRVFIMGGFFGGRRIEHNFYCDPVAANVVFSSGLPITVSGLQVTLRAWLGEDEIAFLEADGGPVERLVADQTRRWWATSGESAQGDSPHDGVCALTALRPELFTTERCDVTIVSEGARAGASVAHFNREGGHEIVTDLDTGEVDRVILNALLRGPSITDA